MVAETCALAVVITVAAGSLRAERAPTAGEAAALASCAVVVVLRVVATCMELSVTRPFRADLLGPRDTPAPPGVMAAYSARLAVSTTLVAVLFSTLAEVGPLAVAGPVAVAVLPAERAPTASDGATLGRRRHPGPGGGDGGERVTGPTSITAEIGRQWPKTPPPAPGRWVPSDCAKHGRSSLLGTKL